MAGARVRSFMAGARYALQQGPFDPLPLRCCRCGDRLKVYSCFMFGARACSLMAGARYALQGRWYLLLLFPFRFCGDRVLRPVFGVDNV